MLGGFNSGWIDFEGGKLAEHIVGRVAAAEVIARLVEST